MLGNQGSSSLASSSKLRKVNLSVNQGRANQLGTDTSIDNLELQREILDKVLEQKGVISGGIASQQQSFKFKAKVSASPRSQITHAFTQQNSPNPASSLKTSFDLQKHSPS